MFTATTTAPWADQRALYNRCEIHVVKGHQLMFLCIRFQKRLLVEALVRIGAVLVMSSYVCWECERDDGFFSPYHPLVSHWIEIAFMKCAKEFTAAQCVIDFASMTQTGGGM